MRFLTATAPLLVGLAVAACSSDAPPRERRPGQDIALVPDTATVKDRVPPRATLASLLADLRLRADVIPTVIEQTRAVFDPRRLHAGHMFEIVRTTDGLLRDFQYEIDLDKYLRVASRAGEEATTVKAEIVPYKKALVPLSVGGRISRDAPSLFAAMEEAGETVDLSLALADIFSGEI